MLNKVLPPALKILLLAKRFSVILFAVGFGAMYGYLVTTASQQSSLEPSVTAVDNAYTRSPRPKFDKDLARQLSELESRNTELQTIFNEARNDPFSE